MPPLSARFQYLLLFLLALLVRLVYLVEVGDSPYADTLVLDAFEYDQLAGQVLQGNWLLDQEDIYVHGPLYPYVLALGKWLGAGLGGVRIAQAILGALSCVLVGFIGGRLFSRGVGVAAALLAAGYWPLVFYSGEILATTLVIFIELALVALLLGRVDMSWKGAVGAGGLLALLAMTRSNTLLALPLVAGWIYWRRPGDRNQRLKTCGVFAGALVLVLSPFLVRNYLVQGSPLPFQGGFSFYVGNNPRADGTPYIRQGLDFQRFEVMPLQQGITGPAAKGAFYGAASWRFIRQQPGDYLALLYDKFRLFWNAFEVPLSTDLRFYEKTSLLHRILVLDFGVLVPLGLVGLLWSLGDWRRLSLLYGFISVYLVTGLLFSVCARYRLPALPFLLVFAAQATGRLVVYLRGRQWRRGGLWGLVLLGAAALVWTGVDRQGVDHLRSAWLLGHVHLRNQRYDQAVQVLAEGAGQYPGDSDLFNSLGVARQRQGNSPGAEAAFRRAVELAPDHARPWINMGELFLRQRRLQEAGAALEKALALDPRPVNQALALHHLGYVFLFGEDFQAARRSFAQALKLRPKPQTHYGLANACAHLGLVEEQRQALEEVVRLQPRFAPALRNLGVLYAQQGAYEKAEKTLLQAQRSEPEAALTYRHLGALYQRLGQQERARAALERARRLEGGAPPH